MNRHTVEKITPVARTTFDQHFWPVFVALAILCGISVGAILAVLRGPWLWGSLLIVPASAGLAIYLLYRLDDSILKRSLQIAILSSLSVHLLLLILASATNIFQNSFEPKHPFVAQQPVKQLIVSSRETPFVWHQTHKHQTPDPQVETERSESTTNVQSQTLPVESAVQTPQPQVVRRTENQESVPRHDLDVSQLRRQSQNVVPKSSTPSTSASVAASQRIESQQDLSATSSETANNIRTPDRSRSDSVADRPSQLKQPETTSQTSTSAERRREDDAAMSVQSEAANLPSARLRRNEPRIPKVAASPSIDRPTEQRNSTMPSPNTAETNIARRSDETAVDKTRTETAPVQTNPSIADLSRRRESEVTESTIPDERSVSARPRVATRHSPVQETTVDVQSPARQLSSENSATRTQSARSVSINRSTQGTAGVGQRMNLDQLTGGEVSPARRPSDSSASRRQDSRLAENIALSPETQSERGRSNGRAQAPQTAVRASTTEMSPIAGSDSPSSQTMTSAVANVQSASTEHRGEMAVEMGSAQANLGPTKIVPDVESNRRGGGGSPDISEINQESDVASGRTTFDRQPSLAALAADQTASPLTPASMPSESGGAQNQVADEVARSDGTAGQPPAAGRSTEVEPDDSIAGGGQELRHLSRSRASGESDTQGESLDGESLQLATSGDVSTRLAQAPNIETSVEMGAEQSVEATESIRRTENRSSSEIGERLADAIPGSSVARGATSALIQAATSLPLIDGGTERTRRTGSLDSEASQSETDMPPANPRSASTSAPSIARSQQPNDDSRVGSMESTRPTANAVGVDVGKHEPVVGSEGPGAALDIAATEGPAGLGDLPSDRLGVPNRPSSAESENIVDANNTRFKRREFGGTPSLNPDAVMARDAFRDREPSSISRSEPTTEAAIQSGLEFLARHQLADGSWALGQFDGEHRLHLSQLNSDTAATGLALLCFQGAGYNHREFKYARQMEKALKWLVDHQDADGGLYVEADELSNQSARMYSHAIAALALTEAYGMTQDRQLREPAQRSLEYIAKTQDPDLGGWRYYATPNLRSSDTSVTGWMMMALQSGRLAGLEIDERTFRGIENWLGVAAATDNESQFRYNPYAENTSGVMREHGRQASKSMTAVGLLMRVYSGWSRSDARFQAGADYLLDQLPSDANARVRDTYYWYYATQVLKHAGGDAWETWNAALQPLLIGSQEKQGPLRGSWHPYEPVPDRWGPHGGRLYVTTMNLLSLEVRYRLLPLYDKTFD
jgi:hypothetical protein